MIFRIFPYFLSFCVHIHAAGLQTGSVLVGSVAPIKLGWKNEVTEEGSCERTKKWAHDVALVKVWGEGCLEGDLKDGHCPPVLELPRGTPEGTLEGRQF